MLEFECRTGRVVVDYEKCEGCASFACVKACSLYGRGLLTIQEGKPVLAVDHAEAKRRCIECLACEYDCLFRGGNGALKVILPLFGLEEYRKKVGSS